MVPAPRSPLLAERLDNVDEELALLDGVLDGDVAVAPSREPARGACSASPHSA